MELFHFKQFPLAQETGVMPLTLDAVVFGTLIDGRGAMTALDVGSGTGIVSLILAQRFPQLCVTGLDIDDQAFHLSKHNFSKGPFQSRMDAICGDFMAFDFQRKFDLIVSNPPFYRAGVLPQDKGLARAKHDNGFSWRSFFTKTGEVAHDSTILSVIIPAAIWPRLRIEAVSHQWYLEKWHEWQPGLDPSSHRLVVRWRRYPPESIPEGPEKCWTPNAWLSEYPEMYPWQ